MKTQLIDKLKPLSMSYERGWCNKVGISPTAAYIIKKRFFEGSLSVKTMNKWLEKAKNFQEKIDDLKNQINK